MAAMAAILDFFIVANLAVFDIQVAPILLTKFRVNWPLGSGEKAVKLILFSRWRLWGMVYLDLRSELF